MKIRGFIWLDEIIDKIESKHNVTQAEVEEVATGEALILSARDMDKKEKKNYGKK